LRSLRIEAASPVAVRVSEDGVKDPLPPHSRGNADVELCLNIRRYLVYLLKCIYKRYLRTVFVGLSLNWMFFNLLSAIIVIK